MDKHIRRLDNDLARFESEIQDKALNSRNQEEPTVGKSTFSYFFKDINLLHFLLYFSGGRKKIKDGKGEKKKRSGNSSEEDSAGTVKGSKKKKQKGSGTGNSAGGNSGGGAKATSGEGSYHFMLFYMLLCFTCYNYQVIFSYSCTINSLC